MGHDIGTVTDISGTFGLAHYNMLEKIHDLVTAAGQGWTVLRYDTSGDNHELILKGEGLTGTEEIFVGFRTYQSADADYYNLVAAAFAGYVSGNAFDDQPQALISGVPAHNQNIDYWITWNAQRIALAMKVGTPVYESAYVGKALPYARPSQFPYPVICAGMLNGTPAARFSDDSQSMPYKGNRANFQMRNINGSWQQVHCYPYSNDQNILAGSTNALRDTGGEYHLMPVELFDPDSEIYGALDGIYFVTGFNNSVENTLTIDGSEYVVIQDVWRTGFDDYYAIRMD
ncbi:hypothetical protein HNR65_002168 [Desulfosalsimonas propionicica]|uniref:Uncharacterized protein n=1 Tax=Desulfosalsimonas propionicica TaxID=332175 RepID=A0A7W0HL22_9BACT|nr:hypothetical protein [Desulfosalsimonas propionicica]MBA2881837.1 hypothetical protein [Desulfosalsimonas propionicica]